MSKLDRLGEYDRLLYDILVPGAYVKTYRISMASPSMRHRWSAQKYGIVRTQVRRGSQEPLVVRATERARGDYTSKRMAQGDPIVHERIFLPGAVVGEYILSILLRTPDALDRYLGVDEDIVRSIGASSERDALDMLGVTDKFLTVKAIMEMMI